MLVSSIGSAQTFDFSCGPDENGITTHDGFEIFEAVPSNYVNPDYGNIYLNIATYQGNPASQVVIDMVLTTTFTNADDNQDAYDQAVAWVLENRSPIPTQTCTPTLTITEGALLNSPGHANDGALINGIIIRDPSSVLVTYLPGDELPMNFTEYEFRINTHFGRSRVTNIYDGSCELVIDGTTDNVNIMEVVETGVINVPEEFRDRFAYITFNKNGVRVSKEDGTQQFTNGETIPDTDTYSIVINNNNGELEVLGETFRTYTGGDINITADIFPNVINIPEALNPWIQRITFQDIQNNSIKHIPDVGGNETNIYDDGDFIPEEATHYRIRIRRTLGTNNGSYETEQISVPSSGDLNIELPTLTIQTGLAVRFLGLSFLIQGLHVNGTDYTNGSPLPSGSYNSTRVWFYNQHGERSTFSLDSHNILDGESVSLTTESSTNYVVTLASVLEAGGDIAGMTYSFAGINWTVTDRGDAGGTQYLFQSANGQIVFVDKNLTVADGSIVFSAAHLWNSGGHALSTNGTEELERALRLVASGVKIFYPNGRSNVTDAFFAIESDLFVTDVASMNKNIIDLTPVNGITVAPGAFENTTNLIDLSVTTSKYYAYRLRSGVIGVALSIGENGGLRLRDSENNNTFGSLRGGTLLWEINGPARINDVGKFRYIKVVNQRHSSWDDVEGYYRIHPAINGGFTDRTSDNYISDSTSGNLSVSNTVLDPDMISEQASPGDVFVIRDNSIDRQGFTVAYARSRRTGGLVYGLIFSFGAPNLGTSLNFNVGHAQKLANPVLQ